MNTRLDLILFLFTPNLKGIRIPLDGCLIFPKDRHVTHDAPHRVAMWSVPSFLSQKIKQILRA